MEDEISVEQHFDNLRDRLKSRIVEIETEIIKLQARKEGLLIAVDHVISEKYYYIAKQQEKEKAANGKD